MWRRVILDVLHHYQGGFTWSQLWSDVPGREIVEIHKRAAQQAREDQQLLAFQTFILAKNPYVGGFKNLEIDDLYTGLARNVVDDPPYVPPAMTGIALAFNLGLIRQAHVDLLGPTAVKWLERRGLLRGGREGPPARPESRRGRKAPSH